MASDQENADAEAIEALLGHSFQDRNLLIAALTHPSLEDEANYQRLEFLGDRVLGLVNAEAVFRAFGDADEGLLTLCFHRMVSNAALAEVANELKLGRFIRMAAEAEKNGGRKNASILADVMEAIIGAIYLDGGLDAVRVTIRAFWAERLSRAPDRDAKTFLQEWLQSRGGQEPIYSIAKREGPDHAPTFTVRVEAGDLGSAEAKGSSRKAAEFAAAAALLDKLQDQADKS
ncbi:MAG: ribonuclease III [Proteobacteria bacterium]|nr:ribonuclease III [Pseudomonadota bacterium]